MNNLNKKLMLRQLDEKLAKLSTLNESIIPKDGWIKAIRTALNMNLSQLAKLLKKTPPTVKEIEEREANKSITLKKLMEIGEALNLKLVYGFIPLDGSLEKMIESRSIALAEKIVMKTSHNMALEDQKNSPERLKRAINERAELIREKTPKYLWD